MNRDELKAFLPHRDPMLLVDEATVEGEIATGKYTVRGDEWFLQGHFPDNPVVPGVILCEMMAQSACVLLPELVEAGMTPYFAGLDKVRFKHMVRPGDTVTFTCTITGKKPTPNGGIYFGKGEGHVAETLCMTGEFAFAVR